MFAETVPLTGKMNIKIMPSCGESGLLPISLSRMRANFYLARNIFTAHFPFPAIYIRLSSPPCRRIYVLTTQPQVKIAVR
jgi:hypothetical protein